MPLADYVSETMKALATDTDEITTGDAQGLSAGAGLEGQKKIFAMMNG
jgi:hypothetical protein